MRFLHIADVHLGMQPDAGFPWSKERGEAIWESFRRIIRLAGREKMDFLLIAGDLFQRQPLLRELKEVNDLFASIPETIVVHLGAPTAYAENVTVAFPDYIKNVVCSEIYPTWEESAIVANTLAIISFALNRVYTEYYPSRGYSFNITNSTAIDQKYIQGRSLFENVVQIVDEIFNSYLRYVGFIEPLAAKFCNGTTSTCDGLSQWGSQSLAQSGATTAEILRNYYGDNIEIVRNVPVEDVGNSYPGSPLRQGDIGQNVSRIQIELNRISQNYPAIPKVEMDGVFGPATDAAVRAFQSIFSLTVDGIDSGELLGTVRKFYGITADVTAPTDVDDTAPYYIC